MSDKKKVWVHGSYDSVWDHYVEEEFPKIQAAEAFANKQLKPWRVLNRVDQEYHWPGDEWGDRASALALFNAAVDLEAADHLIEIGSGSGRYTQLALECLKPSRLLSFDVSPAFEKALRDRFNGPVKAGQIETYQIDANPRGIVDKVRERGLIGQIDALYSFDALVHVDLHTVFIYWLSATKLLREGGRLAMNVADASSDHGFQKLIHDAPGAFKRQGNAGPHFMWIGPDIVESCLTKLGFAVEFPEGNGRDLSIRATLVDPERGREWFGESGAGYFDMGVRR